MIVGLETLVGGGGEDGLSVKEKVISATVGSPVGLWWLERSTGCFERLRDDARCLVGQRY